MAFSNDERYGKIKEDWIIRRQASYRGSFIDHPLWSRAAIGSKRAPSVIDDDMVRLMVKTMRDKK